MIRRKQPGDQPPQDHSYRCSTCALNYPYPQACAVCGGQLAPIAHQPPTEDLEYQIELMLGELPEEGDKVFGWRTQQLVQAGAPLRLAERIAAHRDIDLHRAVAVVAAAGPDLAREILL